MFLRRYTETSMWVCTEKDIMGNTHLTNLTILSVKQAYWQIQCLKGGGFKTERKTYIMRYLLVFLISEKIHVK